MQGELSYLGTLDHKLLPSALLLGPPIHLVPVAPEEYEVLGVGESGHPHLHVVVCRCSRRSPWRPRSGCPPSGCGTSAAPPGAEGRQRLSHHFISPLPSLLPPLVATLNLSVFLLNRPQLQVLGPGDGDGRHGGRLPSSLGGAHGRGGHLLLQYYPSSVLSFHPDSRALCT